MEQASEFPTANEAERVALASRARVRQAVRQEYAANHVANLAVVAQVDATLALVARLREGVPTGPAHEIERTVG